MPGRDWRIHAKVTRPGESTPFVTITGSSDNPEAIAVLLDKLAERVRMAATGGGDGPLWLRGGSLRRRDSDG